MDYVLDACALISYLNSEDGNEIVENLLKKAVDGTVTLYMSIINLIEVHYGYVRDMNAEKAAIILGRIHKAPITIISTISEGVFQNTVHLKASYRISLADAVGLAAAKELSAQFVTSDHAELEPVEQRESISILWLPAKPKKIDPC